MPQRKPRQPNVLYFMRLKSRIAPGEMARFWKHFRSAETTPSPHLGTIWQYAKALHSAMNAHYKGQSPWTMRQIVEVAVGLRDVSSLPPVHQYLPTVLEIEMQRRKKERIAAELNTPWRNKEEKEDTS